MAVRLDLNDEGDGDRGGTAQYHHPEEAGIAEPFLEIPGHHAWQHHAQGHESRAEGIVRCLEFTLGEIYQIEHVGSEAEAVAELFHKH